MSTSTPGRHDRSRRSLLRGRLHASPALRPPWALDEARFVEACTGCGKCVDACPEKVLVRGEGGLPVFDPHLGECSFCGDCATACGDAAFVATDTTPWNLQAHIGDRCLAVNGIVCSSCRDACGETAIRFPPTRAVPLPQVMAERCTGCGACVSTCPTDAISLVATVNESEAIHA